MGLIRRRPVARMAVGAAVVGGTYHAGKSHEQQQQINDQAQYAYQQATQQPQPQYAPQQYPPPTQYAQPAQYGPPPQQYAPDPQQYAPAPPAPPADNSTDELARLAQLHASGVLTDDEFSAAKAKVLGI